MSDVVEIQHHGSIVEIGLNRPDAYNALNWELLTTLAEELTRLATDSAVKGITIVGRGKAFCSGGDLRWIHAYEAGVQAAFHKLAGQFHWAITEIRRMGKPVIATINGAAAGGGFSLALGCDFRIMEESAVLRQGYTSAGLCLDGGGSFSLPRLVGLAKALEIVAWDPPISAKQALEWGLVTKVVEDGKGLEATLELLQQLAKRSTHAYGWCKQLMTDSFDTSFESQIEKERTALEICGKHPEGQEGIKAFLEKRKPSF